jgi:calcium-dependent protein kinase
LIENLLSAINYCHNGGVVHRDLKPENILLEKDLDLETMKIIDFGLSKDFDKKKNHQHMFELVGTPFYIAPEVLKGEYNFKCDIWSIGVITFMLLSGKAPFFGKSDTKIFDMIRAGKVTFKKE